MRRRLSYANVAATLALVFAMSGGAVAANHYLINSTKQINPKVLKKLKGRTGAIGATGLPGAPGAPGAASKEGAQGKEGPRGKEGEEGPAGEPGPLLTTLPSGKTERGSYGFAGTRATGGGKFVPGTEAPYPIPLSFTPTINVIKSGGSATANCPGNVESPTSAAGVLCVYEEREDVALIVENLPANGHYGFLAFASAAEDGNYEEDGTWAVTAP
jgi:hypothetical protein